MPKHQWPISRQGANGPGKSSGNLPTLHGHIFRQLALCALSVFGLHVIQCATNGVRIASSALPRPHNPTGSAYNRDTCAPMVYPSISSGALRPTSQSGTVGREQDLSAARLSPHLRFFTLSPCTRTSCPQDIKPWRHIAWFKLPQIKTLRDFEPAPLRMRAT